MYCLPDEVLQELYIPLRKQLSSQFPEEGALEGFLEDHIKKAGDYVDAYLGERYVVPFTPPYPSIISTITAKIAAYFAVAAFSEREGLSQDKKDIANQMLERLLKGAALPGMKVNSTSCSRARSEPRVYTDIYTKHW